jgi:hypothetical protein
VVAVQVTWQDGVTVVAVIDISSLKEIEVIKKIVVKKRTMRLKHNRGTPDTNRGNHRLWNREQTPPQPSGLKELVL